MTRVGVWLGVLAGAGFVIMGANSPVWAADCNRNGINDSCDVNCGPSGGECDVPGCAMSFDGNFNGIPDECEGYPRWGRFTTGTDFAKGHRINVDIDVPGQVQRNQLPKPLPNLWVAASNRGTVVRIDTTTGEILGEYFTAPDGRGRSPSRTAVNLDGELWVTNRDEDTQFGVGSATKIGLVVGGTPVDMGCVLDNRVTYAPPFVQNTCIDRNGDGYITTSGGLVPLPWPHPESGPPVFGSVATAVDECIVLYVPTTGKGARHVSVDRDNNVWVGGHSNNTFDLLDGFTGEVVKDAQDQDRTFNVGIGGYGGLIDGNGVLWSVSRSGNWGLFRYNTAMDLNDPDCCQADILTDSNNDGVIDGEDELVEDESALTFPVNSDDDNYNDVADYEDEGPVYGEDDLQEIKLFVSCYLDDPDAWWSLSWVDPNPDGDPETDTIKIWRQPDKSDGQDPPGPGVPLVKSEHYQEWPVPSSVWLEALDAYDEIEILFMVWHDDTRATKIDTVKTKVRCTPGRPRFHVMAFKDLASVTGISADITLSYPLPNLCGSPPDGDPGTTVGSYAFAGVTDFQLVEINGRLIPMPFKWAQLGVMRRFKRGVPFVELVKYAEVWSGNQPPPLTGDGHPDYHIYKEYQVALGPSIEYKCWLTAPVSGQWQFWIADEFFRSVEHDNWKNATGNNVKCSTETLTAEDERWGTAAAPAKFEQCRFRTTTQDFTYITLTNDDLYKIPPAPNFPAEIRLISNPGCQSCAFEVWDTRR